MRTPELSPPTADYLRTGSRRVEGWLNASTGVYMASLAALQHRQGLHGDVCEIGVHHGKSFLCLALGLAPGERAVAVDVFGDQAANLDRSGMGDRAVFEGHLAEHGVRDAVDVVGSSSLALADEGFVDAGRRFRLFSVDGGHTAEVTRNDLELAERTVVDGGLVLLDDVLNRHWLGVITGLFDYWARGGSLVPAVLVPDRLLLATSPDRARECRALMSEHFTAAREKSGVPLGAAEIDVYGQCPWVVVDESGGEGLLPGPASGTPAGQDTLAVPTAYLRDLEERVRLLDRPLTSELARRYPEPARRVRPLVRLARRARRRAAATARRARDRSS